MAGATAVFTAVTCNPVLRAEAQRLGPQRRGVLCPSALVVPTGQMPLIIDKLLFCHQFPVLLAMYALPSNDFQF